MTILDEILAVKRTEMRVRLASLAAGLASRVQGG